MPSAIDLLARAPDRTGLFFDFDGTLSEIALRPEHARPLPGLPEVLDGLAETFRVVSVVSGRSAAQLAHWLADGTEIWGLYGAQLARRGEVQIAPEFKDFEKAMASVLEEVRARVQRLGIEGVIVEDKHVMVGLHWRMALDRVRAERELTALAAEFADLHDLRLGHGKMALELRPPVAVSKKDVVLRRAREEELTAVAFSGDDVGDLPAYDALDELQAAGVDTVRIAVGSEESPAEVTSRADLIIDGPEGMYRWLQELRAASDGVAGSPPS